MDDSLKSEPSDSIESPGSKLASIRQASGRSQADIAAALKLPRSIIEAIEGDRIDRIAPIYRRGYLANYARELGQDPADFPLPADEPPPLQDVLPPSPPQPRMERFVRYASYFVVTTLIVPPLVYFFVTGGTRIFDSQSDEVAAAESTAAPATGDDVGRRIARALALDESDTQSSSQGPLSASALPLPALRAADAVSPEPAPPVAVAESTPEVSPLHRLELSLSDDSWVEIADASGERLEFDLLRAGAQRRYEGLPPFRLLVGRANAVEIRLDGEIVRFDGADRGSVAEFTLDLPTGGDDPSDAALVEHSTP